MEDSGVAICCANGAVLAISLPTKGDVTQYQLRPVAACTLVGPEGTALTGQLTSEHLNILYLRVGEMITALKTQEVEWLHEQERE